VLESNKEVSKVIRRSGARIVEVNSVYSILVKDGLSSEITDLDDQLMKLDCVLQFVRSGRIAVTKSRFERVDDYLEKREAKYKEFKL
jgi:acetolactate synthase-1/3 small subunit